MTEESYEACETQNKIEVLEYTEMEDGSAVVVVNISMEAAKAILEVGLRKLILDYVKDTLDSNLTESNTDVI